PSFFPPPNLTTWSLVFLSCTACTPEVCRGQVPDCSFGVLPSLAARRKYVSHNGALFCLGVFLTRVRAALRKSDHDQHRNRVGAVHLHAARLSGFSVVVFHDQSALAQQRPDLAD